jgi:hypothetical protein
MESETRLGDGRYVVRGVLGEGAQGVTYDAIDMREGRPVAIKRFDVRGARSWKDVELAEREARVLATLDHPLVPRYLTHFEDNGALYLVMEKIEGETLDAIGKREGALPEDEVRRFLACADRALTYLHGRGSPVVHRDIKPKNVVRRADGSYVFVDFGAVSELVYRRGSASTVVGTIGYMAPEQFQGRASPATDVYAVGATALAALTGAEPETFAHHGLRVDVRGALQGRCSPAMVDALERMLEPDPDVRPASLGAALDGARFDSAAPRGSAAPAPAARSAAPVAAARSHVVDSAKEDALVKSLRKLLWVLWGLGWVIVPTLLSPFHQHRLIPTIMFGWMAALLVVTWHKGAVLRAALRALENEQRRADASAAPAAASLVEAAPRHRVEVAPDRQVRVHASDLRPEDLVGATDVKSVSRTDARAQARAPRS